MREKVNIDEMQDLAWVLFECFVDNGGSGMTASRLSSAERRLSGWYSASLTSDFIVTPTIGSCLYSSLTIVMGETVGSTGGSVGVRCQQATNSST